MKFRFLALVALASAFALTPLAKADSITFVSHVGNDYNYSLTLDHSGTYFAPGSFALTGLSGVTSATLSGNLSDLFSLVWQDAHTVLVGTWYAYSYDGKKVPYSLGTLTLTSTDGPGPVNFFIADSHGLYSGKVTGPSSSPVPEPSSLLLLGTGLVAAAGAARRKFFA